MLSAARRQAKLAKKNKNRKQRVTPLASDPRMAALHARQLEGYAEIESIVRRAVSPSGLQGEPFTAAAVIHQVSLELDHITQSRAREAAKIAELEADGWRIVSGGQVARGWETTDWRTGEVLARGKTLATYEKHEPPPPEKWHHIDHIADDAFVETKRVADLPERFANELIEWTCENEEKARALIANPDAEPVS